MSTYQKSRRLRFAETDASGFAYFDSYIRMMEETEYSFLRSRNLRVVLTDEKGIIGFPRLSAEIAISEPVRLGEFLETNLELTQIDGKKIVYEFKVICKQGLAATGQFQVACCRFPPNESPYAILIPQFVIDRLTGEQ